MDGDKGCTTSFVSIGMALLFGVVLFSPLALTSAEDSTTSPTLIDGRVTGFQAEPSQQYLREWLMEEGEWFSLILDCNQCEAQMTLYGNISTTTSELSLQAVHNGTAELSITSAIEEYVSYSLVEVIDEQFSHLRTFQQVRRALDSNDNRLYAP